MIEFQNVSMAYGKKLALEDVSFRVDPGEIACITGPSGAGKTTILSLLLSLSQPMSGTIAIDGMDLKVVPAVALRLFRERLGIVFQDVKLLPTRTVFENIAFPLEVTNVPDVELNARVQELLAFISMTDRASAFPRELTAEERVRVGIARSIARAPLIVVADNPTTGLTPEESERILNLLSQIHRAGATVIVLTRKTSVARMLGARELLLDHGRMIATKREEGATEPGRESRMSTFAPMPEKVSTPRAVTMRQHAPAPELAQQKRKIKITPIGSI